MAEEARTTETTTEQQPQEEPQGTDWKAEARKWEKRAKENGKSIDELRKLLDGYEARDKDEAAKEAKATEALKSARAEIDRLKAEAERDRMVREVAKSKGVDADVLALMRAETAEEIAANADLLLKSAKAHWPEVRDGGQQKPPAITRDEILAERNPRKQLKLIAENRELFK